MDPHTGELYTREWAQTLPPEKQEELVFMEGSPENIRMVSEAVKRDRRAQNKRARKARRKNR